MKTPFEMGFRAREQFEPMHENPHSSPGKAHGEWNDGWRSARNAFLPCPICRGGNDCGHAFGARKSAAGGYVDFLSEPANSVRGR